MSIMGVTLFLGTTISSQLGIETLKGSGGPECTTTQSDTNPCQLGWW